MSGHHYRTKSEHVQVLLQLWDDKYSIDAIARTAGCSRRQVFRAKAKLRERAQRSSLAELRLQFAELSARMTALERRFPVR